MNKTELNKEDVVDLNKVLCLLQEIQSETTNQRHIEFCMMAKNAIDRVLSSNSK